MIRTGKQAVLPSRMAASRPLTRSTDAELNATVADYAERRRPEWIALRRDLHRNPEVGFTEYRTQSLIACRLADLGYSIRAGAEVMAPSAVVGAPEPSVIEAAKARALQQGASQSLLEQMEVGLTALVGELRSNDGPTIAIRFDVDALPIAESRDGSHAPARLDFASSTSATMHACGHDGHAAIGVAVAELAEHFRDAWSGTLRLIFQPAEEGGRGAWPMVCAGVVDDVDFFFSLHLGCNLPSGSLAARASDMLASSKWDAAFSGCSAHAAGDPQNGRNALLAAAVAALGLHALPRHGQTATHVNVGRLEGGSARNAVADHAGMSLELRAGTDAALVELETRARLVIEGAAMSQGCTASISIVGQTARASSTPEAVELIQKVAVDSLLFDHVLEEWPLGGGDDATFFMRRVQERGGLAAYMVLGSDLPAGHHTPNFDFTEGDIDVGARFLFELIRRVGSNE